MQKDTQSSSVARDTILITHANPEDNLFARWLATRLSAAGYRIWVDVQSLRGGNDFWDVIEAKLRFEAIKQIVVISEHIRKPGVKKELALGDYIGKQLSDPDFMIPIRNSAIAHGEFPPELLRRNSIDAFPNWASALPQLLDTLSESGVQRQQTLNSDFLHTMIAAQEIGRLQILDRSETLQSNWFEIETLPEMMRLFAGRGTSGQFEQWLNSKPAPYVTQSNMAATFCDPTTFAEAGRNAPKLEARFWLNTEDLLAGRRIEPFQKATDARNCIVNLIRQHWDNAMVRRGLQPFEYATGNLGWFFPDGLINGPVKIQLPNGQRINRRLSGKFKDLRWHLCLIARPRLWPSPIVRIHANVALTVDGQKSLPGEKTQRIRMRLTKSWWNDKWRDLLLAGVAWLADGKEYICISAGTESFNVKTSPISFEFPVSYDAREERGDIESDEGEIALVEDLDTRSGSYEDDIDVEAIS